MNPPISWTQLFDLYASPHFTVTMRVIKKSGEPFLILPESPKAASTALALYPAQTNLAKTARRALSLALRMGLPAKAETVRFEVSSRDPFAQFLMKLTGDKDALPPLAILAGNPRAEGRRFILLLFDEREQPICIVKAGIGESARRLIQKETSFLRTVDGLKGLPELREVFSSERLEALALSYVPGEPSRARDWRNAATLLTGWINPAKRVSHADIPAWRRLETEFPNDALLKKIATKLKGAEFRSTLYHGDFAPWNIKVSKGEWIALDWERGELAGFPAWDWFHYVIQAGILVDKLPAEKLIGRLEELLADSSFQHHAKISGIEGREKLLAVAYLFYCVNVLKPTEGRETAQQLLSLTSAQWLG